MQNEMSKTTKAPKFTVHDTFNNRLVSTHRTLEAAAKAQRNFLASVKRANGPGSYLTTVIRCNGERLTDEQFEQLFNARIALDNGR